MKVEHLDGAVHIDDLADGSVKVVVTGAIDVTHALSVASQAVTEVGLDGEWQNSDGAIEYVDLADVGEEGYRFRLITEVTTERTCEGYGPAPETEELL